VNVISKSRRQATHYLNVINEELVNTTINGAATRAIVSPTERISNGKVKYEMSIHYQRQASSRSYESFHLALHYRGPHLHFGLGQGLVSGLLWIWGLFELGLELQTRGQ
jgi:hypothetical protein